VCNSPTGDGANLCRTHTSAITHLLRQIPDRVETVDRNHLDAYDRPVHRELRDRNGGKIPYQLGPELILSERVISGLASDLETTITRQDKLAVTSGAGSSGEKPLNWNERASTIRWELRATLSAWALETSKHHQDSRDPAWAVGPDIARVAEWLLRNINTLRLLTDVGEAYAEINDAIRRAESAIDRPAHAARFVVGPCPEVAEDESACPGEVWAFIPISEDKPAMLVCQNDDCAHAWNTTQWMRVSLRIRRRIEQIGWRPTYQRASGAA
jgi:hypothetical protein